MIAAVRPAVTPSAAMELRTTLAAIDESLRAKVLPGRAEGEKAYLKSDLDFYGVAAADVRAAIRAAGRPGHDDLVALTEELWASSVFEHRLAAVELLRRHVDVLGAPDVDLVERMLRGSHTWALVDPLAISVAGPIASGEDLDRWSVDDNFWLRRSALLALLGPLRSGGGDFERFGRYADAMLDEREFFVRKAIGWVLRDTGRKRPDLVFAWILPRASRSSGITLREAVKPLSEAQRAAVLAAR